MFSPKEQEQYFMNSIYSFFTERLKEIFITKVENNIKKKGKVSNNEIDLIFTNHLKSELGILKKQKFLFKKHQEILKAITKAYGRKIDIVSENVFENFPLTRPKLNKLREVAGTLFLKDVFPNSSSGVVIAGYGEKEHFPTLISFKIDGIALKKLKYKEDGKPVEISSDSSAAIVPFAQSEMVYMFMEGIDPVFRQVSERALTDIFNKYPKLVADNYGIKDSRKIDSLGKETSTLIKGFFKTIKRFSRENFVSPVINVVASLPKNELAEMVENLVSLTSFKRRISEDEESVGGPIDVAVISKGDGFIWIKRKHYFDHRVNKNFSV